MKTCQAALALIAGLLCLVGARCSSDPAAAHSQKSRNYALRFEPEPEGRRQLSIRGEQPNFHWRLRVPERVFCDEAVLVGHDIQGVRTPVRWSRKANGALSYRRANRDDFASAPRGGTIDYEVQIVPQPYGASLTMTVTNTGTDTLHNVTGHLCLGHLGPGFRDPRYERTYIRHEGRFLNLRDSERGTNPIRAHYRVREYPLIKIFAGNPNAFWGLPSREVADNGLILTRKQDGNQLVAFWCDPAGELFQNSDESNMCIHSDPIFGDLAPQAAVKAGGRLILFDGGLEEFERAYLK